MSPTPTNIEPLPGDVDEMNGISADSPGATATLPTSTVAVSAAWSLIGAGLLSADAARIVASVNVNDWPTTDLWHVAEAIRSLVDSGDPVDPITVSDWLRRRGYDPMLEQLHRAFVDVPAVSAAAHYADIVTRDARHRRLVELASRLGAAALDGDDRRVDDVLHDITHEATG